MNSPGTNDPARRSALITIFLTVFIDLLGFGIIIPLLPVYSKAYGASEIVLGALFASFSAMQFFFAPMWGRLSDRIGRRPVLIGGLVGTAASYGLFAYASSLPTTPENARLAMGLIFGSRFAAGFFGGNISTAQAYIADVTHQADRAKGMGLIGAAFGLGFTVGPLVGGELTKYSHQAPGIAAAALSLGAAAFGYFRLTEPVRAELFGGPSRAALFKQTLGQPRLLVPMVLSYFAIFAFSGFESMFTRFGLARFPNVFNHGVPIEKATLQQVFDAAPIAGRYLAGIGIISAVIQGGFIRRLVPRFGETLLVMVGPAILGVGFLIIGVAVYLPISADLQWYTVMLGCLVMPFGFGLNNPSLASLISRAAPEREQGGYLGLSQSISSFGRMTGPPFAGWLFASLGAPTPFFAGAATLFVAAALARWYHRRFGATFPRREKAAKPAA